MPNVTACILQALSPPIINRLLSVAARCHRLDGGAACMSKTAPHKPLP